MATTPAYAAHYKATKRRLDRQRGPKVARVDVLRMLSEAIWYMLTCSRSFAPAGPAAPLAAWTNLY